MKRSLRWTLIVAGLATCAVIAGCGQQLAVLMMNQIETSEFTLDGNALILNGEINSKTLGQFEAIVAENPGIEVLVEETVPGSLDDDTMIALAYRVRELGLSTHLRSDSAIDSGGVDLFLAGVNRTMEEGAHIGVHSWSDGIKDAADYPRDAPEHEANRKYIEDMLGNDQFYWFTIYAAPAAGIHAMTTEEIIKFGLLTAPMKEPGAGW